MYEYHTLANGIKIVFARTHSCVAYSGVYIGVGSRHEDATTEGMAHFIEHSLFKGTTHRRAYHIQNRIDGVGGELNAFTTKEETCIYASSLVGHLERCLELFADVLFCSTFPDAEIEKEKEVVVEEINSYSDSPAELIYDQFEELAFEGHPLAHNILGTKKNVRHFKASQLRTFFADNYTPQRMVVAVAADEPFSKVVRLCERYFGSAQQRGKMPTAVQRPAFRQFSRQLNRRTHQTHVLTGCAAPDIYNADKTPFSLLNNILGGPAMNSRLNVAIRERYGFCYTIESQYVPFSDAGLFYIYAGVDHGAQQRVLQLVQDELHRAIDTLLTPTMLRAAQRQMMGQMAVTNDLGLNEMQSIGKAYLYYDKVDTLDEMFADIMAVSAADLQRVAAEWLKPEGFSTLTYAN